MKKVACPLFLFMPQPMARLKIITISGLAVFFCLFSDPAHAANSKPTISAINPPKGSINTNAQVFFTTTCLDRNGWKDIKHVYFLINSALRKSNCFYAYYNPKLNKLYLMNDTGTKWIGGFAPGSRRHIENSYARLDCSKTTVKTSTSAVLSIKWAATFKPTFTGKKNEYLYVMDKSGSHTGWVREGRWLIDNGNNDVLSISVSPKLWSIGLTKVKNEITMTSSNKITVTNNGTGPETLSMSLTNPPGWTASTTTGVNKYVLSGIFCNYKDIPGPEAFNKDASYDDVILTSFKKATKATFGYSKATASGISVPAGDVRSLYLQFKLPTATDQTQEQSVSVVVSCQTL